MDPYLEDAALYPDFHHALAVEFRRRLTRSMPSSYVARVESRAVTDELDEEEVRLLFPDVAVAQREQVHPPETGSAAPGSAPGTRSLTLVMALPLPAKQFLVEIRLVGADRLVTAIEIVSRSNKRPGSQDAQAYERKRTAYLSSDVNFVEIDLVREGRRWPVSAAEPAAAYRVLVSRASTRPRAEVWPIRLPDPLPHAPIPLLRPDPDAVLPLGDCVRSVYEDGAYHRTIDYRRPVPGPPLDPTECDFVTRTLAAHR